VAVAAASARTVDQLDEPASEQANPATKICARISVHMVIGSLGFPAGRCRCEAGPLELRFNSRSSIRSIYIVYNDRRAPTNGQSVERAIS
jgi:hypothetical protein